MDSFSACQTNVNLPDLHVNQTETNFITFIEKMY